MYVQCPVSRVCLVSHAYVLRWANTGDVGKRGRGSYPRPPSPWGGSEESKGGPDALVHRDFAPMGNRGGPFNLWFRWLFRESREWGQELSTSVSVPCMTDHVKQ